MSAPAIYALYKGDEFIDSGTAYQLARRRGVKPSTIRWYSSPSAKKRSGPKAITVVRVS